MQTLLQNFIELSKLNLIKRSDFYEILLNRLYIQESYNVNSNNNGMPKSWTNYNKNHFIKLFKHFDVKNYEVINVKKLLLTLILNNSPAPKLDYLLDLNVKMNNISPSYLSLDQFKSVD